MNQGRMMMEQRKADPRRTDLALLQQFVLEAMNFSGESQTALSVIRPLIKIIAEYTLKITRTFDFSHFR